MQTGYKDSMLNIQKEYIHLNHQQTQTSLAYVSAQDADAPLVVQLYKDSLQHSNERLNNLKSNYRQYIRKALPNADDNDTNYIFLRFVVDYMPVGLVGLLIAIIFLAAWGSIAAALNSLASCSMIDFHLRFKKGNVHLSEDEVSHYKTSKLYTLAWGIFSIVIAQFAYKMGSLIEAVNVLGSLFYGVILGIFLVAFYFKKIGANAVFISAIISEIIVVTLFILNAKGVIALSFLWLNVVGALSVVMLGLLLSIVFKKDTVVGTIQ